MRNHLGYSPQTEKIYLRRSNGKREDITNEFISMVLLKYAPGYQYTFSTEDGNREYEITVREIKKDAEREESN